MDSIAIFGGSFDPIHLGHIQTCQSLQKQFHFCRFLFLPCKEPLFKDKCKANNTQRIDMLELALAPYPDFELDFRELERDGPSYMVTSLTSLRAEHPQASLTLILGYDAFLGLEQWFAWERILTLAHLLVMKRAGLKEQEPSALLKQLIQEHAPRQQTSLLTHHAGYILEFDAGSYSISSTAVRQALQKERDADAAAMLPEAVWAYIKREGLYR